MAKRKPAVLPLWPRRRLEGRARLRGADDAIGRDPGRRLFPPEPHRDLEGPPRCSPAPRVGPTRLASPPSGGPGDRDGPGNDRQIPHGPRNPRPARGSRLSGSALRSHGPARGRPTTRPRDPVRADGRPRPPAAQRSRRGDRGASPAARARRARSSHRIHRTHRALRCLQSLPPRGPTRLATPRRR